MSETPNPESEILNPALDLSVAERVVTWRDRPTRRVRRVTFAPLTKPALKNFYRDLNPSSATAEAVARPLAAHDGLFFSLVKKVEGYEVGGGADLMSLADWKRRVPRPDRRWAVTLLLLTRPHEGAALADLDPEFDIVALDALWNPGPESKPGEMQWHCGLVHRFDPFTAEDDAALDDDLTQARAIGGSRSGAMQRAIRELVLLAWYDKKISAIEGYSVAGQALSTREEVIAHMDPFHKIAAMQQLKPILPDAEMTALPGEEAAEEAEAA